MDTTSSGNGPSDNPRLVLIFSAYLGRCVDDRHHFFEMSLKQGEIQNPILGLQTLKEGIFADWSLMVQVLIIRTLELKL